MSNSAIMRCNIFALYQLGNKCSKETILKYLEKIFYLLKYFILMWVCGVPCLRKSPKNCFFLGKVSSEQAEVERHWRNGRIRANAFLSESPHPGTPFTSPELSSSFFHHSSKTTSLLYSSFDHHEGKYITRHQINVGFTCSSSQEFGEDLKEFP